MLSSILEIDISLSQSSGWLIQYKLQNYILSSISETEAIKWVTLISSDSWILRE